MKRKLEDDSNLRRQRSKKECLQSVVCAVSIFSEGKSEASYSEAVRRLTALGAKVSSNVHKRVQYLMATNEAVQQRTQRVRKAIKYNVPIVSIDYITACEELGHAPRNHTDFSLHVVDHKDNTSAIRQKGKEKQIPDQKEVLRPQPRVVDLGCCCSCHDNGALSCSWCLAYHNDE